MACSTRATAVWRGGCSACAMARQCVADGLELYLPQNVFPYLSCHFGTFGSSPSPFTMPTGARLLLVAAWAGTRMGGAEGSAEFAETSVTAPAPTQHQLLQQPQPQQQPADTQQLADTQQQHQQYHHQQQRSLSEDAPVSWLSSPDLMARRSTQLSGNTQPISPICRTPLFPYLTFEILFFRVSPTHPFLPYVAPHISHISPLKSCFFEARLRRHSPPPTPPPSAALACVARRTAATTSSSR